MSLLVERVAVVIFNLDVGSRIILGALLYSVKRKQRTIIIWLHNNQFNCSEHHI